jgi:hypothetical protein
LAILRIEESLDLELSAANASGLVPMYLSAHGSAILEPNLGGAFAFSPPSASVRLSQALDFTDSRARGDGLNVRNCAYDLKVHV